MTTVIMVVYRCSAWRPQRWHYLKGTPEENECQASINSQRCTNSNGCICRSRTNRGKSQSAIIKVMAAGRDREGKSFAAVSGLVQKKTRNSFNSSIPYREGVRGTGSVGVFQSRTKDPLSQYQILLVAEGGR